MKHFTNYSLKQHNTLKIEATCLDYFFIENKEEINALAKHAQIRDKKRLIIGEGANILFTKDFDGIVLNLGTKAITVIKEDDTEVMLEVDAGVNWHALVTHAVSNNWGGIENMVLIPGLVGAAAVGNIAAYGQNFSDVCTGVTVYAFKTGKTYYFSKQECGFSYRESSFKHELKDQYMIVSVFITLQKNPTINSEYWSKKHGSVGELLEKKGPPPYSIHDVADAVITIRKTKFPDMKKMGTAGSFFKNPVVDPKKLQEIRRLVPNVQYYPIEDLRYIQNSDKHVDNLVKVSAGEILDTGMGYRGLWEGNVGLYEKHALVLVTNGHATAQETVSFADKIENDFEHYCGVKLEKEVILV